MSQGPKEALPAEPPLRPTPPMVSSTDLLQGKNEMWIRHAGQVYRLRLTRSGKLILQK